MTTKGSQEDSPCSILRMFFHGKFLPGLRESTDAYRRYDISMKQKLPIKGLELYLNISNLTEAVDIRRLRGYNPFDPNFLSWATYTDEHGLLS